MTDQPGRKEPGEEQLEQLAPEQVEEVQALGAVVDTDGEAEPHLTKIDLHCHSQASSDCSTPLSLIPGRCRERGVGIQAITDHNEVWGALELKALVEAEGIRDLQVIVGEEVSSREGEIIGLFLREKIPAGMSPEETILAIKEQGGLVLLPHGFDPLKRWRLQPAALERVAPLIDVVETFNARISRLRWNRAAVDWAQAQGVLMSAGSDAHTLADIGSAWVEAPDWPVRGPQDLLRLLKDGIPVGQWTHPAVAFVYKLWDRTRRRLLEA